MSSQRLADENATEAAGAWLLREVVDRFDGNAVVFLEGDLGAGKTTMVRGLLRAAGHTGNVKSPTYTLMEPYEVGGSLIYHFDLYRVNDPQELEFVGIDEIVDGPGLKIFEWPQRAAQWLPEPQVAVQIDVVRDTVPASREVCFEFA